jgi:long-chain acyl-CoA synthetase
VAGDPAHPILDAWEQTLRRSSDPAIFDENGQVLRTFEQIEADAQRFSGWEAWAPLESGAVVAVQIGNSPFLPGLLLALWRRRCIPVLLDRSLDGPSRENALAVCRVSLVTLADSQATSPAFPLNIDPRHGEPLRDGTQFLKLTSGTSNTPRAIRFTASQLLADCESICDTMGIGENDLNFGVIPWSHSYGFSNLVTPLLCRGVPVVATEDRLPRAILNHLIHSKATVFPGLPVFFQKLCDLTGPRPEHLRLCISAGAPLPHETAQRFRQHFGLKVHGFYGSSECGGIAYDISENEVPAGCVGEAMKGVRLVHDETTGRIEVHSPAVGLGYFPEPDLDVLGNGRFVPGDLLCRTPQGLIVTGRVSDFINIAGRKLNPVEVEHVLRTCPGVREAIVFGVPHPHRGEEPIACIVGEVRPEVLQAHCAKALLPWQIPRDFWFLDMLPINERGKFSRRGLAELYLQRQQQRAPL